MQVSLLRAKIHRATITNSDLNYEGSISIDRELIDACGMLVNEKVDVLNINNGQRFTTYVIEAKAGSREIQVNGAAARLVQKGDKVIIVAYASFDIEEAKKFKPAVILLDDNNEVIK